MKSLDFFDGSLISDATAFYPFEGWNFSKTSILSARCSPFKGMIHSQLQKKVSNNFLFYFQLHFSKAFSHDFSASTLGSSTPRGERQLILRALEGVAQRTCSDVPAIGGKPPARSLKLVGDSWPRFDGWDFFGGEWNGVVTVTYINIRYLYSISILGKDSVTIVSRSNMHVITSYNIMFWLEYFACSTSANMLKIRSIGLITIPKPQHCMYDSQFILAVANI